MEIKKRSRSFSDVDSKSVSYYDRYTQTYTDNNQNLADYIDEFLGLLGQDNDKNAKRILDLMVRLLFVM